MNNPRDLPPTFHSLVTSGLGYCCEYFFFEAFKEVETGLITTRLGCHPATTSKHRRLWREGKLECAKCAECLKPKLEKLK